MAFCEGDNGSAGKQRIQIYSTPTDVVSNFSKEKYERDAKKYWDIFYKRHENRFFKDRHYLDKEWGHYFSELCKDPSNSSGIAAKNVVLEVGCGAGNTIFPLLSTFSDLFVYACDFSPRAINLIKSHKDYKEEQVHAFVCDVTADDLTVEIPPASVDIVTMIFVLSAVSPEKMSQALQNIRRVLKPNGHILMRDYAVGDLAQERLTSKEQKLSENFYVRGDGTRVFYFSEDALASLFMNNGFISEKIGIHCKRVENRSRELVMDRRWIQGAFSPNTGLMPLQLGVQKKREETDKYKSKICDGHRQTTVADLVEKADDGVEIDLSESIAIEMLGGIPHANEVIDISIGNHTFNMKCLSREYQHTCKSTGFMLWESARMLSSLLAANPDIVAGRHVLELGCGSSGICSIVAAKFSDLMVATDGDPAVMDLLNENIEANTQHFGKVVCQRLEWANKEHIHVVRSLSERGFDVIIGTDVTYAADAILPLFETIRALISKVEIDKPRPAIILCHVIRRVDEGCIISAASQCGFHLEDKWPSDKDGCMQRNLIASWFPDESYKVLFLQSALRIMYFCL